MDRTELDQQAEQLKTPGVVENLQTAFAAPAFLAKMSGDQWQMVVDYRKLNDNVEPDRFPLPRVDTIFDSLRIAIYFSHGAKTD